MNSPIAVSDNISELLIKILEFTEKRQKVLTQNIHKVNANAFVPRDLEIYEFCDAVNLAIVEHTRSKRLLLCDSDNVKFGEGGSVELNAIIDKKAKQLLDEGKRDEYLELQIDKLLENSLNQRVAAELLRHNQANAGF